MKLLLLPALALHLSTTAEAESADGQPASELTGQQAQPPSEPDFVKLLGNLIKVKDLLVVCRKGIDQTSAPFYGYASAVVCEKAIQLGYDFSAFIYNLSGKQAENICWRQTPSIGRTKALIKHV